MNSLIKQRRILNCIAPDFKRDTQTQEEYIHTKRDAIIDFVERYMREAHSDGIVLGVSGGIDSFLCANLCAQACENTGKRMRIVLLPNGEQSDFTDAEECAENIVTNAPHTKCDVVPITNGYNGALEDLKNCKGIIFDVYTTANLQPRLRMMYQYAIADRQLVAGTDHSTESIVGFYTKFGDGASDINPIQELIKNDIYDMSKLYNPPACVMKKAPAAGLGISETDEDELGISYKDLCAYLRGCRVAREAEEKIETAYEKTAHKRALPASLKEELGHRENTTHIHVGSVSGSALASVIGAINAHPERIVLYVGENAEKGAFCERIKKTVNTPISHYNVFVREGERIVNKNFDDLFENIESSVTLTGELNEDFRKIAAALAAKGTSVTLLQDCFIKAE